MKYLATSRSHKSNANIHNIHAQIIQNENHHLIKICVELKNQLDPRILEFAEYTPVDTISSNICIGFLCFYRKLKPKCEY